MTATHSDSSILAAGTLCNSRIKSYPDGSHTVLCCSRPLFSEQKQPRPFTPPRPRPIDTKTMFEFDMVDGSPEGGLIHTLNEDGNRITSPQKARENLSRAVRRARTNVRDIALCTKFTHFVTLTLDPAKIDRFDINEITRKLNRWLDHKVRSAGLSYVLVPERHKDGAIHFHGFFNGALEAIDSGTISMPGGGKPHRPRTAAQRDQWLDNGGQIVYNLPAWTLGYTTAIALYGDYNKAVSYVCKYVGKAQGGALDAADGHQPAEKIGGRWYYSGGELGHPEIDYVDCDFEDMAATPGAFSFEVPAAMLSFVQITLKRGESLVQSAEILPACSPLPSIPVLRPSRTHGLRGLPS